ncbi:MAG: riboflavin synthase [Casimicrobiaceae bacterium]
MFTGIIEAMGHVVAESPAGEGRRIAIDVQALDLSDVVVGDSIAIDGCCLTVVGIDGRTLAFDVSAETLAHIAGLQQRRRVNLEKSLRLADRLGGHLVQGHVDGVGTVAAFAGVTGDEDRNWQLVVDAPLPLARFIARKGSIAINGVSLTVNRVDGARFEVNLIPHTLAVTTLHGLVTGARVNLEVDMMARYAARLLEVNEVLAPS